ncbi:nucleoside phosphorylase [Longispora sp. K20-0274]|uniref:nucleoside phosphorylase n=1 Tax=Longispora sp. K20-0274 TaxID=3088255 RepID=UPI00399AA810
MTDALGRTQFPNFPGKYQLPGLMSASDYLDRMGFDRAAGGLGQVRGVILVYQGSLMRRVAERWKLSQVRGWHLGDLYLLEHDGERIGVCGGFGFGAPVAALVAEYLIALSAARIITVGTAGGLLRDLRAGDIVLCEGAIRDEGVSHHYLAPAPLAFPSEALTARMASAVRRLGEARTGLSWTIDTPHRESADEIAHYASMGALAVEMEAAALFAVGCYRKVQTASSLVISDSVAGGQWSPNFGSPEVQTSLDALFTAALIAMVSGPTPDSTFDRETGCP